MKLYNSLTNQKEELIPDASNVIKMYSCGPTVYYYAHIGNMRAYLFMDILRKAMLYNGHDVNLVMNLTDVGHLTSDADEGEDKMAVASKRENKNPYEIAEFYSNFYFTQAKKLNIDTPTHVVKATSVIEDIIEFVKGLLAKNYAYETSKGIYFDVNKFSGYGRLSGIGIDERKAGARIEVDEEKRHPADFALWIKAPKEHLMQWQSPWGMGYPGWHIECSTIGKKYLGDSIDIHTGGIDHKTIHHENEIAQSDSLEGKQVVKKWMHVEFLQVDGGKMSKSLNNIYTIDQLEEKGFDALDFRYFFMTAHYKKQQNFTFDALTSAHNGYKSLKEILKEHKNAETVTDKEKLENYEKQFLDAINDDLNMPLALSVVWNMVKEPRSKDIYNLALKFNKVLSLNFEDEIPQEIKDIAEERLIARQEKNWAKSDELRERLKTLGYEIKDSKDGYSLNKI